MFKRLFILVATVSCAFAPVVLAKDASPLSVSEVHQAAQGVDRVFSFTIGNALDREVSVRGRVVVISVYGTSLPTSLPVERVTVPAHSTSNVTVRWHDAPIVGQMRATIVLDEGTSSPFIASYTYWLLPNPKTAAVFAVSIVAALLLIILLIRFMRHARTGKTDALKSQKPNTFGILRGASSMLAYAVEPDDTVMSLSSRFDVTWQDLVRANKLKPPYTLVPGKTIRIPRHALKIKPSPPQS